MAGVAVLGFCHEINVVILVININIFNNNKRACDSTELSTPYYGRASVCIVGNIFCGFFGVSLV